jgi:hypothetical protein
MTMKALDLLDLPEAARASAAGGVLLGTLVGFVTETRTPLVLFDEPAAAPVPARSAVDLGDAHVGRRVLLLCEAGDRQQPIVIGWLREPEVSGVAQVPVLEVDADGTRVVVNARERLVLRCGKASITLTNSGKVLIDGEFTSLRAAGVARIKGGSVQIN